MSEPSDRKRKIAILVVDDDLNERRSLVIGLRLEGFEVDGASGGVNALEMLAQKEYSAVIIDLMMPEMNGLQLARAVRASYPSATTIMMSAYHLSPVQLARADTGVVGFVPKPFSFDKLVSFILKKVTPDSSKKSARASRKDSTDLYTPLDIPAVVGNGGS